MAYEQLSNDISTTLSADITSSATSITVVYNSAFPTLGNFRVRIEDELLLVTAISGSGGTRTWTVTRGTEGTTGVAHVSGTSVIPVLTTVGLRTHNLDYTPVGVCEGRLSIAQSYPSIQSSFSTTLYYMPYKGNRVCLLSPRTSELTVYTIPNAGLSVAVPSVKYTPFDVFVYADTSDVLNLATINWSVSSALTITNITAALEPTVTFSAAHGLSANNQLFISGVVGSMGAVVNDFIHFIKTVPNSTTITLTTLNTSGLTYTSGGSAIPRGYNRATGISVPNNYGFLVANSDTKWRYLGTCGTLETAGRLYDNLQKRMVWNYYNRWMIEIYQRNATSHSLTAIAPWKFPAGDQDLSTMYYACGLVEDVFTYMGMMNAVLASTGHIEFAIGYSSPTRDRSVYLSVPSVRNVQVLSACILPSQIGINTLHMLEITDTGTHTVDDVILMGKYLG